MARSATVPATRTGLKWPLDQCASLGLENEGGDLLRRDYQRGGAPHLAHEEAAHVIGVRV